MKQKVSLLLKNIYLVLMTLNEAFIQLTESASFKEIAKGKDSKGGKYRIYLTRFRTGKLKAGAITEILIANGYEIKANKVIKKKVKISQA